VLTVLSILGVLVVLFIAAAVATREGPILAEASVDRADLGLPEGELQPEDLHAVRFSMAVRGYRMDEVDRVLDRAAEELARRDQRILELRPPAAVSSVVHPASVKTELSAEPAADVPAPSPDVPAAPPADVAVVPVELAPLPDSASVDAPPPPTGDEATAPPD
jgi:DivIVA domain-containing protein